MQAQRRSLAATVLLCCSLAQAAVAATASFAPAVTYPVGTHPVAVATADFNGDGKLDLAVANSGDANVRDDGGLSILLGHGDGSFDGANTFPSGKNPRILAASDFNRDGNVDLVFIDSVGVGVLLGRGDGTFGPVTYLPTAAGPAAVAVADLNGDDIPDLVVAASSLSVLLGNGDGTFQSHVDYPGAVGNVVIADVNGDGKNDIIESHLSIRTLLGNGDGSFQSAIFSPGPTLSGPLAVADFNRDGKLDLAISFQNLTNTSSGTVVMQGNGDGTFQLPSSNNFPSSGALSASDLNGDEKNDLLVVSNGNANVLLGNGDGTFQSVLTFTVGAEPYSVVATDFNHDKAPDLVITNPRDNNISVLLNTTGAAFSISASAAMPATVGHGQSSTSTVTLSHQNTFDNSVALTCSVQPTQSALNCSLNPNSIIFDSNGNATARLTMNAGTATASLAPFSFSHQSRPLEFLWLPVAGLVLTVVGLDGRRSHRKRLMGSVLSALLLGGLILQVACGDGSNRPRSQAYTVTVTGTSQSMQHSTTVDLAVR